MRSYTEPILVVERCPDCGARLRVRRRHADGNHFLGCSAWPSCDFAEPIDARSQRLAKRLQDVEVERDRLLDQLDHERRSTLPPGIEKLVTDLVVTIHPDHWPGTAMAHEAPIALL